MMKLKVYVTASAKNDLRRYLRYVRNKLKNPSAAESIAEDFRKTKNTLSELAKSIREPESDKLKQRGLKRINFISHDYFLLDRLNGDTVEVTNMFHELEDFENKLR